MMLEERIRELCAQAIVEEDDARLSAILIELRAALQAHCDQVRMLLSEYPLDLPSMEQVRAILLRGRTQTEESEKLPQRSTRRRAS